MLSRFFGFSLDTVFFVPFKQTHNDGNCVTDKILDRRGHVRHLEGQFGQS